MAREHGCRLVLLGDKRQEDPLGNSIIHRVLLREPCDVAVLHAEKDWGCEVRRALVPAAGKNVHVTIRV